MLERRCIVGKKMTGIDPDFSGADRDAMGLSPAEKNWLDRHPPIKSKNDEERGKMAARMHKLRGNPS
jgi:hypothetical protein